MNEVVKIEKVVIKIGKNKFELSLEEAKGLQRILNETFGNNDRAIYYPSYPYTWPYPWITYTSGSTYTISNNSSDFPSTL